MEHNTIGCGRIGEEFFDDQLSLTAELSKISGGCEVLEMETSFMEPSSNGGIEATDIGSLLDQFLEYEQGSDLDVNSYPNSSYMTPCGSPSGSDDAVLGCLMIVQEKLSQEVSDESISNSLTQEELESMTNFEQQDDSLDLPPVEGKYKGLSRTINGIHPKGDNIRMADSPKFAKFKRKRLNKIVPLRRCVSGTNTPRATSPSDIVSPEEKKKREAKLIEALALPYPLMKSNKILDKSKTTAKVIKNDKKQFEEPLASRTMPVVSKRNKLLQANSEKKLNETDIKNTLDPRLKKQHYGIHSNITNLADTNLIQSDSSSRKHSCDDHSIVDMTIDHDAIAGTILTSVDTTTNEKESHVNTDALSAIVKVENIEVETCHDINDSVIIHAEDNASILDANDTATVQYKPNNVSLSKESRRSKRPKNYRKNNNMGEDKNYSSASESSDNENNFGCKMKKRRCFRSPSSNDISKDNDDWQTKIKKSPSRDRSKSPLYRRSELYASRSKTSRSNSDNEESEDIKEKLIELSNPVPYDIEHERKVRFLVGETSRGTVERRNIYVGGINKCTNKIDLAERFQRFGHIEKITLHFRQRGDNYAFIVFDEPEDAMRAIEEGNDDPKYAHLELCFGGRRKFVGGSYVDFDGNNSYLEESELAPKHTRCESPENDFDRLLKMAIKSRTTKREKETSPEWT